MKNGKKLNTVNSFAVIRYAMNCMFILLITLEAAGSRILQYILQYISDYRVGRLNYKQKALNSQAHYISLPTP